MFVGLAVVVGHIYEGIGIHAQLLLDVAAQFVDERRGIAGEYIQVAQRGGVSERVVVELIGDSVAEAVRLREVVVEALEGAGQLNLLQLGQSLHVAYLE